MPPTHAAADLPPTLWVALPDQGDAQSLVREWLAQLHARPLADFQFQRDARGRPQLQGPWPDLDCNWSHSGGHLLASCVRGARVGVDLEGIQANRKVDAIAERYFTRGEQQWLAALSGQDKSVAFHRLWCAKEAMLKAHGHGLAFGLDALALLPDANGTLAIRQLDARLGSADTWTLREWRPAPNFIAALAVWHRPPILGR